MEYKNKIFIGLFTSFIVLALLLVGSFFYFYSNKDENMSTQQSTSLARLNQEKNKAPENPKESVKKQQNTQKYSETKIASSGSLQSEQSVPVQSPSTPEIQAPACTTEAPPTISEEQGSQDTNSQQIAQEEEAIAEAQAKAQALKEEYEAKGYNVTINQK